MSLASTLIRRALTCADGFDAIGLDVSADLTRNMAINISADHEVAPLYAHWIGQQEQRLAAKVAERMERAA